MTSLCQGKTAQSQFLNFREVVRTYRLCDIVYNYCAVCISVVHWRQGFVAFLTSGVPYFELDGSILIKRDCLGQKSCTNRRFAIIIELVFDET